MGNAARAMWGGPKDIVGRRKLSEIGVCGGKGEVSAYLAFMIRLESAPRSERDRFSQRFGSFCLGATKVVPRLPVLLGPLGILLWFPNRRAFLSDADQTYKLQSMMMRQEETRAIRLVCVCRWSD